MAKGKKDASRRSPATAEPNDINLDPKLDALDNRLKAATTEDQLTLDATTLGSDGAAIVALMQEQLGADSLIVAGNVKTEPAGEELVLKADALQSTVVGISQNPTVAYFGVDGAEITIQLQVAGGTDWTLGTSFQTLADTWAGNIKFTTEEEDSVLIVLASRDGKLRGDSEGLDVTRGLNLKAPLDTKDGAAKQLTSIVTGAPDEIQAIGKCQDSDTMQSLAITGQLPSFSFHPPLLPNLNFDNPHVTISSELGRDGPAQIYDAYVEAGADVGFNSNTLPMVIRVPTTAQSWQVGLNPERSVSIAELASFFTAFTGLHLLDCLPTAVQGFTEFELQSFLLYVSDDLTEFQRLKLALGTPQGEREKNVWTIIPGPGETPILALANLRFDLDVQKKGDKTRGALSGVFELSETIQLEGRIGLPIGDAVWTFNASSGAPLPNLQDFARFLGGQSLADLVPHGLGSLTAYTLNDLSIVFDPKKVEMRSFALSVVSSDPWQIIQDQLKIENVLIQMDMENPLSGTSPATGRVGGMITLSDTTHIEVEVYRGLTTDPWRFSTTVDMLPLPSLGDLASLAGGEVATLIPETLRDSRFCLSDIVIEADISNAKMERFGFHLGTDDTWTIIAKILEVKEAGVFLDLDWKTAPNQRTASGAIFGDVAFCEAEFWLEAAYQDESWTLSAKLLEDNELTLEHLVNAFDDKLWPDLHNLGVPNVALKSAEITYETGSGSYSFAGSVGPASTSKWTLPVGITNISIEKLGGAVTCTRTADGAPADTSVFVTGTFLIGESLRFKTSFKAGADLTIDCTLEGTEPVSLSSLVENICDPGATSVTWTAGFTPLDKIFIDNAEAKIVLGFEPAFELSGKVTIDTLDADGNASQVDVAALCVAKEISGKWEFAFAIRIDTDWSLPGFTDAFAAFGLDKSTWMIAASSFTDTNFEFPPTFPTPQIAAIDRGLDFYGTFSIEHTLETIQGVLQILPEGTITHTELTVHGLLADPLTDSFIEVFLVASPEGVPLLGWDDVRLGAFALRLKATPAFALHGDFIIRTIKNPDESFFHLIIDLEISLQEVRIVFEPQPGEPAIFTWQDAFGIDDLDVSLTDLALGIVFEPPALDGTIGGKVDFEHRENPTNSVLKNALPTPASVALMEAKQNLRILQDPEFERSGQIVDYSVPYDQDGIEVYMKVSFLIVIAEPPVPYPHELAGRFINFTLPYILKRFADIDVPPLLMPIQFPDVEFDFVLPDPSKPGKLQDLKFSFKGEIIIFGLHGKVEAEFDEKRIKFAASSDPIAFEVDGNTIVAITKSKDDHTHGPDIDIDSKPGPGNPQIRGDFYCDFFDFVEFEGALEVLIDEQHPEKSRFKMHFEGDVGSLTKFDIDLVYQDTNYLSAKGGFHLNLTPDNLPGFSHQGVEVAEKIDLSKCHGQHGHGVIIDANLDLTLDDRKPSEPDFRFHVNGSFDINLSPECQFQLSLGVNIDVNKQTMASIPEKIVEEMATNTAEIFGALIKSAPCFAELLKAGVLVLEETAKVAAVLNTVFATGIVLGCELLHELSATADSVADALWSIFGSHSSKENTSAMKHGGYSSKETGKAIKKAADDHGAHYTPQDLVHDQASAGYDAVQVTDGLCEAFPDYKTKAIETGKLLADTHLTEFTPEQVAAALFERYRSSTETAAEMASILGSVYTGSSALTPQEMADALAPLYPAPDVAAVLRNHFPDDTKTPGSMTGYLLPAYQKAGHPLAVADLAGALAPLYPAASVAPVLHDKYSQETDTAIKLGGILKTAYEAGTTPLNATTMAEALATVFTTAKDIVTALQTLYPSETDTAMKMGAILKDAYPQLTVGGMAQALRTGQYPGVDIAEALKHFYPGEAGTPAKLAAVLAGQEYTAPEVAPILRSVFPDLCNTAAAVAEYLIEGFGQGTIDAPTMALALARAPFGPVETAPVLKSDYAQATQTASAMALLLMDAYKDEQGHNTITAETMAQALAAAQYKAEGDDGTGRALISNYQEETATALAMSKLLKQAPYGAASVGQVLVTEYSQTIATAAALASVFAQTPFEAHEAAPVIKIQFGEAVPSAEAMYGVLDGAYTDPRLDAQTMAGALAVSPYEITEVAPALKQHYEQETTTASKMYGLLINAYVEPKPTAQEMANAFAASPYAATEGAPVLHEKYSSETETALQLATIVKNAYTTPPITSREMLDALTASQFSALCMAPAVESLYSPTAEQLGQELVATLHETAPPTPVPLGVALRTASFDQGNVAKGVKAGIPETSAGVMAAVLLLAFNQATETTLNQASECKKDGDSIETAAKKTVESSPELSATILVTALNSVFTPPNPALQPLLNAATKAYGQPNPADLATGTQSAFPETSAADLLKALQDAFSEAEKPITPGEAAAAVAKARAFIGEPLDQESFAKMVVEAYSGDIKPTELAKAIVSAFGAEATPATLISDLKVGYHGTTVIIDARVAAQSIQQALALGPTDADKLVGPLSEGFELTRCPNDVGALAIALKTSDFTINASSAALAAYFGESWTPDDFAIVSSAFTLPEWDVAVQQREAGQSIEAAAPAIFNQHPDCQAALMVQVLAAVFDLTRTEEAIDPMAHALKAVQHQGHKAYTLNEASAAMRAQYAPDWAPSDWKEFMEIYES